MEQNKKTKFLVDIAFIGAIILIAYIIFKYLLVWFTPLILGFGIAFFLRPLTGAICKYMHMRRRPAAVFSAVLFYTLLFTVLWVIIALLAGQIGAFVEHMPTLFVEDILPAIIELGEWFVGIAGGVSDQMGASLDTSFDSIVATLMDSVTSFSSSLLSLATSVAKKLPIYLIGLVFTIISSIYICVDYRSIVDFLFRQIPKENHSSVVALKDYAVGTVGKMLKAYLLIMLITFTEISAGLFLLGIPYYVPIAAFIAVLDILPLIGSGGILVPWALLSLLGGDKPLGIGLLLLYAILVFVRNIIEPRIVGGQVGLHPLATITAMFFGMRALGFAGIFLGPLLLLFIMHLNDMGIVRLYKV